MVKRKSGRTLVLGVGNILLRDEGLGVRTIEYIRDKYVIPEDVSVVDGGTAGLGLLSLIKDFDNIIIVDAVVPRTSPGALYRIPGEKLKGSPPLMATAHQLGVRDMLAIAELEGLSAEVVVIGMEPMDVTTGLELSGVVSRKLPEAAAMVIEELKVLGIEVGERR